MSDRDTRVDAAISEYYAALESGTIPDRESFLNSHPDLRGELDAFLSNKTIFDRLAGTKSLPTEAATVGSAAPPNDALGSLRYFGDYELLDEIARGGMGVVFRARQVSLNRIVALKMILAGQFARPEDVQRFRAEAEAAAALDHPNILPVYEVGALQGQQYFAMKLVEGDTFAKWMKNRNADSADDAEKTKAYPSALSAKSAFEILISVSRAVHFAHQRGILHRDLKPGNILLDRDGTPFVTDFGLAKKVESDLGLTQTGAIVGTPSYMAPEQARADKQLTTAVDVYSLGAILYEVLTGQPPFKAATVMETVLQVLDREPEHPTSVNKDADRDLTVVALKCLEKDPARRYHSAAELADELERWQRGEPIFARKVGPVGRFKKWAKRRPAVAGLLMSLIATLLSGSIGLWMSFTQTRQSLRDAEQQLYVSRVTLADREIKDRNFDRAVMQLNAAPKALRGWEWNYLTRRTEPERARIGLPLAGLRGLAASQDGKMFAVSGEWRDHIGEIYSGQKPALATKLVIPNTGRQPAYAIAVSGDGRLVAISCQTGVHVWQADGSYLGQPVQGQVHTVALNHDGSRLAAVSQATEIGVWSIPDGKRSLKLTGDIVFCRDIRFHPSRPELVIATGATETKDAISFWNIDTGEKLRTLKDSAGADKLLLQANAVAFSHNGAELFVSQGNRVFRYDEKTGARRWILELPIFLGNPTHRQNADIESMCFSPDGNKLAVMYFNDKVAHIFDLTSNTHFAEIVGHADGIKGIGFHADGSLLTASHDATIRQWDLPTPDNPRVMTSVSSMVTAIGYAPDGKLMAIGYGGGECRLIRQVDGKTMLDFRPAQRAITRLAFSPDGQRLALTASHYSGPVTAKDSFGVLKVIRIPDGAELMQWVPPPPCGLMDVSFDPTGQRLLVSHGGTGPTEIDAQTGQVVRTYALTGTGGITEGLESWSAAYRPDGQQIAVADFSRSGVVFFDVSSGREMNRLPRNLSDRTMPSISTLVRYSPDGGLLAEVVGNRCCLWEVASGRLLHELQKVGTRHIAFSPNSRRLLTVGTVADLWDTASGESVYRLANSGAEAAAIHPRGHWLAISQGDEVLEFDAQPKIETITIDMGFQGPAWAKYAHYSWKTIKLVGLGVAILVLLFLVVRRLARALA